MNFVNYPAGIGHQKTVAVVMNKSSCRLWSSSPFVLRCDAQFEFQQVVLTTYTLINTFSCCHVIPNSLKRWFSATCPPPVDVFQKQDHSSCVLFKVCIHMLNSFQQVQKCQTLTLIKRHRLPTEIILHLNILSHQPPSF